jgi:hypothetical protein
MVRDTGTRRNVLHDGGPCCYESSCADPDALNHGRTDPNVRAATATMVSRSAELDTPYGHLSGLLQIAFLNGRQEPIVESADAEFQTLGIQFRGYFDLGVAQQEFRAGVRAAGV